MMSAPISISIGLEDAPVTNDGLVSVRALRVALAARFGAFGGVYAFARPVALRDQRRGLTITRPVLDPGLILFAASVALSLTAIARRLATMRARQRHPTSKGD